MRKSLLTVGLFALSITSVLAQTTFNYTGAVQTYVVPANVTQVNIACYGAAGGGGAMGAYVTGNVMVTPGATLNIYVGGAGTQGSNAAGGYNGGGQAGAAFGNEGSGGGASDVRVTPYGLTERIIVAGGAGGNGGWAGGAGGAGDCTNGQNGGAGQGAGGGGGTQSAGGAGGAGNGCGNGAAGSLGQGGTGGSCNYGGGGGGGGYYGGGGGGADNNSCCADGGGGGGGSSLTPAGGSCNGAVRAGNGMIVITPITFVYTYTGGIQNFTVPSCVYSITAVVEGAQGGGGGNGAQVSATIPVLPGAVLNVTVGGAGTQGSNAAGGFNGGGQAGAAFGNEGSGGGASDLRFAPYSLADRAIVAAGGGGVGGWAGGAGGAGGCTLGSDGGAGQGQQGFGGTQSAGGAGGLGNGCGNGAAGSLGAGGAGGACNYGGGGGGGGYYGGGGGGADNNSCCADGGGGGGGSSLVPSGGTCNGGVRAGNGQITITVNIGSLPNPGPISGPATFCAGDTIGYSIDPVAGSSGYAWTLPAGSTILNGSNTDSITVITGSTSGNIQVVVQFPCTPSTSAPSVLAVTANSVAITGTASSSAVCAGDSVTLNGGGGVSYVWSGGVTDGVAFAPSATDTYTVTGTGSNGCTNTAMVMVTVVALPTAPTGTGDTLTCGDTTTVYASGSSGIYSWYNVPVGGSAISTSDSLNTGALSTTTTYYVQGEAVSSSTFVLDTMMASGNYIAPEHNTYSGDDRGGIAVTQSYFYYTGDANTVRYDMPGLTNPTSYTRRDGMFTDLSGNGTLYTLWNGTSDPVGTWTSFNVTSIRTLNADLTLGATTITLSQSFTMGSGNDAGIYSGYGFAIFYTGGGAPANTFFKVDLPSGTVTNLGTGTLSGAYVTENWSHWGVAEYDGTNYSVVYRSSTSGSTFYRHMIGPNTNTSAYPFTNLSDMACFTYAPWYNRWYWHHEGGSQFGGSDESVGYCDGAHTQSVASSCAGPRTPVTVVVNPIPVAASASDTVLCAGDSTSLAASGGDSYMWMPGMLMGSNQNVAPGSSVTYVVTVTNSLTGCSNTDSVAIMVNALPAVTATAASGAICMGYADTLMASGASTYVWSSGGNAATEIVMPTSNTTYTVTGTDANGCVNNATVSVDVNSNPVVTLGADSTQCGGSITLDAMNAGAMYMWSDSSTAQMLTVSSSGNYYVTVTDSNGCWGSDSVNVTINPNPVVNLGADTMQCGGTVTLDAMNAGSMYMWNDSSSAQTLVVTSTGTYYVAVTDSLGCMGSDTVDVSINTNPTVTGSASSTTVCADDADVTLTGAPAGGTWSGPGVTGNNFDPSIGAGAQTVTYTYTDSLGCSGTANVTITVNACVGITDPAFANGINVYPNPNTGSFTLTVGNNVGDMLIEITDATGRLVYNSNEHDVQAGYSKQINMEGMANGIYMMRLTTGSEQQIIKISVQN